MEKQVKCKKCKLTYKSKIYECPYCHTKRFNPKGLIITIIVLIVALGAAVYFKGTEIKSIFSSIGDVKTFRKDGITYNIIGQETEETFLLSYDKISIDIINNSNETKSVDVILSVYADGYLQEYNDNHIKIDLEKGKKYKEELPVYNQEWEQIEIYGNFQGKSELMFKITKESKEK